MSEYERYKEWFRRQLEIDILILDHPTEKETLEGILDIRLRPAVPIKGDPYRWGR